MVMVMVWLWLNSQTRPTSIPLTQLRLRAPLGLAAVLRMAPVVLSTSLSSLYIVIECRECRPTDRRVHVPGVCNPRQPWSTSHAIYVVSSYAPPATELTSHCATPTSRLTLHAARVSGVHRTRPCSPLILKVMSSFCHARAPMARSAKVAPPTTWPTVKSLQKLSGDEPAKLMLFTSIMRRPKLMPDLQQSAWACGRSDESQECGSVTSARSK